MIWSIAQFIKVVKHRRGLTNFVQILMVLPGTIYKKMTKMFSKTEKSWCSEEEYLHVIFLSTEPQYSFDPLMSFYLLHCFKSFLFVSLKGVLHTWIQTCFLSLSPSSVSSLIRFWRHSETLPFTISFTACIPASNTPTLFFFALSLAWKKVTHPLKTSICSPSSHTHRPASSTKHFFSSLSNLPANLSCGSRGQVKQDGGVGLRERCIHQTRGGFQFCVKSGYQKRAGYASWENNPKRGGAGTETGSWQIYAFIFWLQ